MDFALITEGISEYNIIKHIVYRYFKDADPNINQIQPKILNNKQESIGGWNEVLKYCERPEIKALLVENDYLIIQIDTDQSQTKPFEISHSKNGTTKTDAELHEEVTTKLMGLIPNEIKEEHPGKIILAICIHTVECWLLPIYYTDNTNSKTNNCIKALNIQLARKNIPTISETDKNSHNSIKSYSDILSNIKKRKEILEKSKLVYSFSKFTDELERIYNEENPSIEDI